MERHSLSPTRHVADECVGLGSDCNLAKTVLEALFGWLHWEDERII